MCFLNGVFESVFLVAKSLVCVFYIVFFFLIHKHSDSDARLFEPTNVIHRGINAML